MTAVSSIRHPDRLFIDGQWVAPHGSSMIEVVNSATEEVFARVAAAQKADIDAAVAAARRAFDDGPWPHLSHVERAGYLRAIAKEMDAVVDEHATLWTVEAGIIHRESYPRVAGLGGTYNFYAGLAETYAFQERYTPKAGGDVALVVREPVGVMAAIVPWNGAPGLITGKVAPALLAGCTVIVKASPEAPGSAYLLAEICERIGLPPGVVNVVTADREVSEHLVAHPGVDKITFTGSTLAGRRIASICGERIARCTLELGGKSPAIILDDFDVATAARAIAARAVFQTGQVCWSITRVIVSKARHDALLEALSEEFKTVTVGDPFDPATNMGPLATSRQRERVEMLIEIGSKEGAKLAHGGARPKHLNRGFFVQPTVFGNVDNSSTIGREEIFGPVLSIIPVAGEDEAVRTANDTLFGLNAAVFTHDLDRAYAIARRVRAGTVGHNGVRREAGMPFGGFKQSGLGREGGAEGLVPYLETKVLILDGMPSNAGRVEPGDLFR